MYKAKFFSSQEDPDVSNFVDLICSQQTENALFYGFDEDSKCALFTKFNQNIAIPLKNKMFDRVVELSLLGEGDNSLKFSILLRKTMNTSGKKSIDFNNQFLERTKLGKFTQGHLLQETVTADGLVDFQV
jgi:hypothetical protein